MAGRDRGPTLGIHRAGLGAVRLLIFSCLSGVVACVCVFVCAEFACRGWVVFLRMLNGYLSFM